ncbi:MAG: hypothetical protein WBC18_27855 [Ottowia sp.]|uniref:hypothetical protein n=1 Tax=unclassified Ottowia TaxID=2645081 RepID=UPI003C2F3133
MTTTAFRCFFAAMAALLSLGLAACGGGTEATAEAQLAPSAQAVQPNLKCAP